MSRAARRQPRRKEEVDVQTTARRQSPRQSNHQPKWNNPTDQACEHLDALTWKQSREADRQTDKNDNSRKDDGRKPGNGESQARDQPHTNGIRISPKKNELVEYGELPGQEPDKTLDIIKLAYAQRHPQGTQTTMAKVHSAPTRVTNANP
ncbi:hypothetical protein R1flu_022640 [Riccia fluitans]|uniref:Uncharacterized protein n=1 Tax=Riccia fluitans TaxID=41844 RepID=A0ABD1XTU4_9MARC